MNKQKTTGVKSIWNGLFREQEGVLSLFLKLFSHVCMSSLYTLGRGTLKALNGSLKASKHI